LTAKTTFVAIRAPGPAWDKSKAMPEQEGWPAHARFMNQLAAESFVLLVVEAESATEVRETLRRDPWNDSGLLVVQRVQPWNILLDSRKNQ